MNDFLELLRTPGDETATAVGRLNDPLTVLNGDGDDLTGPWMPWAE